MNYQWQQDTKSHALYHNEELIGRILTFEHRNIEAVDSVEEVDAGVFLWTRQFIVSSSSPVEQAQLTMEFAAAYEATYCMIPGISYNGNPWGSKLDIQGFQKDGQPWVFAHHRTAVAGATYSENESVSVALFANPAPQECGFSASLIPEKGQTIHRLLWPEEESPYVFRRSGQFDPPYRQALRLEPESPLQMTAILVLAPVSAPRSSWHTFLDVAWRREWHKQQPAFAPADIWRLGIRFAKESLWAEEGVYRGFSIGLLPINGRFQHRPEYKYEIGWCGQNLSLANSLLMDYLWHRHEDSLEKGLVTLDTWATHAPMDNGLIHVHFDPILVNAAADGVQDTCNLGGGALDFLEAYALTKRLGIKRENYLEIALGILDFSIERQGESGRFAKSWRNNGDVVDPNGTIGAFLIPPLLLAYRETSDDRYLDAAKKSFAFYTNDFMSNGYTTAGALDTYCIDKESASPLLDAALGLYEITHDAAYIKMAEYAAYYLASWQWHHTVQYADDTMLRQLNYDTFGGTTVSTQHHHLDPYGCAFVNSWLRLAQLTGKDIWRQRAQAVWANGTQTISDGHLTIAGKLRPAGSQGEAFYHTYWGDEPFTANDWLVAWPTAFRLRTLRTLDNWSVLENKQDD
jgi:hypothetical protein